MDVCSSGTVSGLSHCLFSANIRVVNVYTDGSLRNLGSREMKCGAAAYFSDLDIVKGHLGVVSNECADKLAGLAASSSLALSVLVRERFIMATGETVFGNVCHFVHEIFRFINQARWEVGPGFNIVDDSLLGDVNWFCTASVWHPDSHMAAGFTSKFMAVRSTQVSHACIVMLSLYISDDVLYTTMDKGFVFRDWVQEVSSILSDTKVVGRFIIDFVQELGAAYRLDIWMIRAKYKALMEKDGLIPLDGFVYPVTHGLSCMFSAKVIRLLGIFEMIYSVALIGPSNWSRVESA
ncbi:hypothetical protein G9A89_008075 [Geosiphon pyriformis]|nr:hypothetical protein G9A89_008075 [Geosiphon pyriformis]